MEFEAYLASKRIDSVRFSTAEPDLWKSWKSDFEQMHPNSFTVRYLNLINPVRRKYQLLVVELPKPAPTPAVKPTIPATPSGNIPKEEGAPTSPAPVKAVPKIPRPGMPKPVTRPVIPKPSVTTGTSENQDEAVKPAPAPVEPGIGSTLPEVPSQAVREVKGPEETGEGGVTQPTETKAPAPKPAKPVIPRPVIKPKPKTN